MRAILAAGITLIALVPAPARAGSEPLLVGTTCGLVAIEQADVTGQSYEGVMEAAVAAVDGYDVAGNPIPLSLTCRLFVGPHEIKTISSVLTPGVAAVADRVSFQAFDAQYYEVCTEIVAVGAGGTNSRSLCRAVTRTTVPPDEVCDLILVCGSLVRTAPVLYVTPEEA